MNIEKYNEAKKLVGNTPIIKLENNIFLKMEKYNYSGSVKDRAVVGILNDYLNKGLISDNTILVEASSGNTGIAVSALGNALGLKTIIYMPESMSIQRRQLIKKYGAELYLTDAKLGMNGSVVKMNEDCSNDSKYLKVLQFENKSNPNYHYETTAEEIIEDIPDIDIFISAFGTGGTISGVGKKLKEHNNNIKIIGVEPTQSPLVSKGIKGPHNIQGIGANFIPLNLNVDIIDEIVTINDFDCIKLFEEYQNNNMLSIGYSSCAAVLAAKIMKEKYPDKKILAICADGSDRYL